MNAHLARIAGAVGLCALLSSPPNAEAKDCSNTSVGFTPLNDLGPGFYLGEQGGLYPGGENDRPFAHDQAGREIAESIARIDGQIVLISIGMSNTTQEFSEFVPLAMNHPERNPALLVVNCAEGGQAADDIDDPAAPYWEHVFQRLQNAGTTPARVRAVWLKEADRAPTLPFPQDALDLKANLRTIVQILHDKFPNLELTYLSSRIYAGYADTPLNPEPFAYQSGFSVKWLIEDQIDGDPGLNFDPDAGPVEAPWLAWGAYLWADGLMPRSDGLIWECDDYADDGTHPSPSGRLKVAELLLDFFTHDPTTTPWFLNPSSSGLENDPENSPEGGRESGNEIELALAHPNPFRPEGQSSVRIPFALLAPGTVRASVIDAGGRKLRTLIDGVVPSGPQALAWDGRDDSGASVPAGVYQLRIETRGGTRTRHVTVLR